MKRNTMNFAVKTLSFALFFTLFLFSGRLAAEEGCHTQNGCGTDAHALYNSTPFANPTYSPSWSEATATMGRVRGGQYLKFSVVEGEIYQWSTEGKEDAFSGNYASTCTSHNTCRTGSDITTQGLRCIGGYCLLPFDTELTLLKGESCSADSELLAYSNAGGFRNQSQIEWKADFTGTVVLLVTNFAYKASEESFVGCQLTSATSEEGWDMTTTVKWHRASSEHCTICDNTNGLNLYKFNYDPTNPGAEVLTLDDENRAPNWQNIQTKDSVNLVDFELGANDTWAKPGSYFTFNVVEDQIYRWSTCIAEFQDTQLTLFKGDKNDAGDGCGEFLAYGDDSKVSYVYNDQTYCPAGTKQTVLEWKANFSGKVTLLMNEYNCSQCYPIEIPLPGGAVRRDWLNCFVEVDGQVYPFPLDWQRYDCNTCEGDPAFNIADNSTSFEGSKELSAGQSVKFSLKRGSKYLFKASDPTAIITVKKGDSCDGKLLAQETGQLAYFANVDTTGLNMSNYTYSDDVITVFVSKADCRPGANTLTYSYYGSDTVANISNRFSVTDFAGSMVVTDNSTTLQFVDTGEWAKTWKEAIQKCQAKTVGEGSAEETIPCPKPQCPYKFIPAESGLGGHTYVGSMFGFGMSGTLQTDPHYNDANSENTEYFCKYISAGGDANGKCKPPKCATNYAEYQKTAANQHDADKQDLFGKCYYGGSECNNTVLEAVEGPRDPRYWDENPNPCRAAHKSGNTYYCDEGYIWRGTQALGLGNYNNKRCCPCPSGFEFGREGYQKNKCFKFRNACDENQSCIDQNTECSYLATVKACPEGYTEQSDGTCTNDTVEPYDVFGLTPDSPDMIEHDDLDKVEGDSCPEGTSEIDGVCEYDGCGQYAYYMNFTSWGGQMVYKYDPTLTCFTEANTAGPEVPCCCNQKIYKFKSGNTQATYDPASNPMQYATSLNDNGTVSTVGNWTCESAASCPSGYTRGDDGDCYKCGSGDLLKIGGEYGCYSCPDGSEYVAAGHGCFQCEEGYTPVAEGEGGGIVCKKECPAGAYQHEEGGNIKCYTSTAAKIEECDTENDWIEEPGHPGRCRKLQKSGSDYVNVACGAGIDPKNNEIGRTCDPDNMNSYDCDCFEDRCEDQTQAADAKVCPNPYQVSYRCIGTSGAGGHIGVSRICYHEYVSTPEYMPYTLPNGETIQVVKTCHYTDSTGQACGEEMGGWTLPNLNQLYSIVDFDLYDPATAYPLKGAYIRTENNGDCAPVPSSGTDCETGEECGVDEICLGGHCTSADPYGDMQCDEDGKYICVNNKCVRNNWYWSSTTVVSENINDGSFTWAVNMEDGRTYRARKGCDGTDCLEDVDLNARPHHVLCIKGSSVSGLFDNDKPSKEQVFSGWACDKNDEPTSLKIYFEIIDKNSKDVVDLLGESEHIMTIPGLLHKGIKYGNTDITPTSDEDTKTTEIYNNCGFPTDPKPHAFEIKWKDGEFTAGKEEIAELIRTIADKECSDDRLADGADPKTDCAVPPYFVTAYGVNETSAAVSAVAISPTERPFVLKNRCGDGYMTYDGDYTETCESQNFNGICAYGNDECNLCAQEDKTVAGTTYKACTYYPANPPRCMDGTIQSYYCEDGIIADGHPGAGLSCEYYNFAASNNVAASEQCDCAGTQNDLYLYNANGTYSCSSSSKLSAKVCPNYFTQASADAGEDRFCYICAGCKKEKVDRAFCGDKKIQRSNCAGYANCETVPGADEECDDGNNSDTDNCTTKCKLPQCGDGAIQPALGEICDSGEKNGFYATNCVGTEACPGCASITCGKPDPVTGEDTDPFGPRCGDGIVQHMDNSCSDPTFITTYGPLYGFTSAADCRNHLEGAAEKCDRGNLNGAPISFADFVNTAEGAGCADTISGAGSDKYPVNALQKKYLECVYKYKQYISSNSGCSADCTEPVAPYCGDGKKDAGETCDEGLPTVNLVSGNYVIAAASASQSYNGKGYGHCRLDCKATYKCDDDILDGECAGAATEGFCTSLGFVENGKVNLYVKDANEYCDDGALNGSYGHCDEGCLRKSYCGNANENCIEKDGSGNCVQSEECDFGSSGGNPNKPIDKAYSKEQYGSCISEDETCKGEASFWGERVCCKYGRYCGDGTVDNSSQVADGINWKDPSNWNVEGANVTYDARQLSLRFELTAAEATAELNVPIPIDLKLRYLLEYNVKPSAESFDIKAGVNEYDASGSKLTNATYSNASPYFFTQLYESTGYFWYRGKNPFAIRDESQGAASEYRWYLGTKTVRILFKMTAASGTHFFIKSLSFYNIENANYSYLYDGSKEMCDPGKENFKTSSTYYMTDCDSGCNWINYCGDSVVQRNNNDCPSGTYNGYPCVDNITYAEEECDNGTNGANEYGGCEPGCRKVGPHCGDGFVDSKSCPSGSEAWCNTPSSLVVAEQCDNGSANSNDALGNIGVTSLSNYGTCREDCRVSRCGDGILDGVRDADGNLIEECDCGAPGAYFELTKNQSTTVNGKTIFICMTDGGDPIYNTLSAQRAAVCRPNCKISRCGDGILDRSSGEECDDGNFNDFDSCTKDCKLNVVGDGIYAHERSYLCEELQGLDAAHLTKLAAKGVVDCGGAGQMTCDDMKTTLTTEDGVKTQFEQGRLHCCFNQKFNAMADDHNCEIRLDGEYYTPKDLIVDRCVKYAFLGNEYEGPSNAAAKKSKCTAETDEVTGKYTAIELCEHCINNKCDRTCDDGDEACKTQRTENCKHLATQTERDKCMENNTYCDATGWNIIGRCGDGKVDTDAGEICDNNVSSDDRKYTDLYNSVVSGGGGWSGSYSDGRHYDGHYCTGECKGSCSETSPICGGSVINNCWQKGCTVQAHRSGASSTETSSCGDGFKDEYAGEECDYGATKHTNSWSDSYCNTNCKYNRKGSASGPIAKCGDGQTQSQNEICDDGNNSNDDYCVADSYGVGCQIYYGSCGDGKITGPGYTDDSKWDDGTLVGGSAGPEDCDINDTRSQSLLSAGVQMSKICNTTTCKRVGSCGDGTRDYRFEGCDNGTGNNTSNITKDGVTCFKGCKSNPKGSLMKATNSEINGWACDPDHPMTHPATLVRIEIYDATGAEVGRKSLATTKDISGSDVATDTYYTLADIAKECGGGSKHGWTFDPSKSDQAMNWEGKTAPFTVKVYATSLDGSPETEVKIGEKQFVRSMMCGDNMTSKCSSIEVVLPATSSDPEAALPRENWSNGRVCHDSEVVDGCAAYGLTDGEACVDEECDKGSANGNDKDCSATCKWTKCGDGVLQANATGIRPDGTSAEECEGSEKKNCTALLQKEVSTDTIANQASCYGTNNPKCKWNKTSCKITSNCPPLSTGITSWGGNYKADYVTAYIEPKNGTTYTRLWTGTGTKGWGTPESVVKYDTVASTDQEKACSYKCTDKFTWDSSAKKCVPNTNVKISCSTCTDPHGVWLTDNNNTVLTNPTQKCTTAKQIPQTVTLNSNGTVTCVPGDCNITAAPQAHGTAASASTCIWTCDNDSKWSSTANTCLANSKQFECKNKPAGTHWMSVTKVNGNIVVTDVNATNESAKLYVTQALDGTTLTYSPSDSTLTALDINDGSNSPKQLQNYLGSEPIRCYYGCPSGSYYEGGSCKTTKCGDGIVNSEHCESVGSEYTCKFTVGRSEVCDDGTANGTYAGVATGSNCKSDCSGKIKGGSEYFCGDKVVQYKSGDTCYGSACKQVTEGNYPGATVSAFGTSEQCDPKSNANDRQALCKTLYGGNRTYYDNTASVPSCTNDCKVSASQYEGCGYCGDGKVQKASGTLTYVSADYSNVSGASEYCDPGKDYNNDTGTKVLCNAALGLSRSSYYTPTTRPTCNSNCQGISNATKGTNCMWCGDGTVNGSEKCDYVKGFSATCYVQNGSYECNCDHGNGCKSCPYYDYYSVSCSSSCGYQKSLSSSKNQSTSGSACSAYGL